MGLWEIIILAVVLGIDATSVALAIGACGCDFKQGCRLSLSFGSFQFIMPIIGWFLGKNVVSLIQKFDHWVAFGLLFIIGVKMLYEAFNHNEEDAPKCDRTRGWSLFALSIATSIDALGAGLVMGIKNVGFLYPSFIIGVTAAIMTFTGVKLGNVLSAVIGKRMEAVGGIVLIGLGIKMLFTA
ncbi:MAG: manganese efflux pump MntP family protein [Candidatus Poribacteria bacterium]